MLQKLTTAPGFASALMTIFSNTNVDPITRKSAAVVLRQHAQRHWFPNDDDDGEPADELVLTDYNSETGEIIQHRVPNVISAEHTAHLEVQKSLSNIEISSEEKNAIKNSLPSLLADPIPEIRTFAGIIIGAIAEQDFENWPELVPGLISALSTGNLHLVMGALRCFSLLTEDFTATSFSAHVRPLFEALINLTQPTTSIPPQIRSASLALYSSVVTSYTITEDPQEPGFEKKYGSILLPTLPTMLTNCKLILENPCPTPNDVPFSLHETNFEARAEAINVIFTLTSYFPSLMKSHVVTLTDIIERSATSVIPFFNRFVVQSSNNPPSPDHPLFGMQKLLANALAFYSMLTNSPKTLGKHLRTRLESCLVVVAPLLQLTEDDCEELRDDVSQFASMETEVSEYDGSAQKTSVLRKEAVVFMCQILEVWPRSAGEAVAQSILRLSVEAHKAAGESHALWWKPFEAAGLLMGQLLSDINAFLKQTVLPLPVVIQRIILPALLASQAVFAQDMGVAAVTAATSNSNQTLQSLLNFQAQDSEDLSFLRARGAWLIGLVSLPVTNGAISALNNYAAHIPSVSGTKKSKKQLSETEGLKAIRALVESRGYLTQLFPLLAQCFDRHAPPVVRISAAISIRIAGIGLANLDQSCVETAIDALAAGIQCPFPTEPVLAPIFRTLLEGLCRDVLSGDLHDEALYCALESIVWATQAAAGWGALVAEKSMHMVPTAIKTAAAQVFSVLDERGATIIAALAPVAGDVVGAVLECWKNHFNDPHVAEAVVDTIKSLTALNVSAATTSCRVLPVVLDVLARNPAEVPASVRMISLELTSHILRNSAPGWNSLPTDVYAASAPALATLAEGQTAPHVTVLNSIPDVAGLTTSKPAFAPAPQAVPLNGQDVVEKLLPLVLQAGINAASDESNMVQGSCALTSTIFAIYGSAFATPQAESHYAQFLIAAGNLAKKMLTAKQEDMSETAIAPVSRLLTQLLINNGVAPLFGKAASTLKTQIFNLAITRLANSGTTTLSSALVLFFCRLILQDPVGTIGALIARGNIAATVEKVVEKPVTAKKASKGKFALNKPLTKTVLEKVLVEMPALQAILNTIVQNAPHFHSAYACKIVFSAIARLLMDANCLTAIAPLTVEGPEDDIDTAAPLMTRNQKSLAKKIKPRAVIPAIPSLLTQFAEAVVRAVEHKETAEKRARGELEEEDLFEESDEENEGAFDNVDIDAVPAQPSKSGRSIYADAEKFENGTINLSDMLDFEEGGENQEGYDRFGDQEDSPEFVYDLMDQIDLALLGLSTFHALPHDLIANSIHHLSASQQEPLQKVLKMANRA